MAILTAASLVAPASAQILDSHGVGPPRARSANVEHEDFTLPLRGPFESPFAYRWGRFHSGIDIGVLGTDRVHAALSGTVVATGYLAHYGGYGNLVILRHPGGMTTLYAHLASMTVKPGQQVERGALVGRAGCTGSCTGQHLHFEVRIKGKPVNPMRYLKGKIAVR